MQVRAMFLPCALHGVEASYLSKFVFLKLRAAILRAVWSRKQPLASSGAVLGLLDGPHGCDLLFVLSGSGFGFFVGTCLSRPMRFLGSTGFLILFVMAALVMVLFVLWLRVLGGLVFLGTLLGLDGIVRGFLVFVILLVLFSIFGLLFLTLGGIRLLLIYALVGAFVVALCLIFLVHISFLTPLMSVSGTRRFCVVSWWVVFGMVPAWSLVLGMSLPSSC